jgi:signal transduction histidine kinase
MVPSMSTDARLDEQASRPSPVDNAAQPSAGQAAAAQASSVAEGPAPERSAAEKPDEPINILLVDDEPKNLAVLESVLTDPRYRLVRAASADEALLALVAEEFALLVLDIQMPGMNGFELAHMIKGRKKTAGVPIIFLTAYYSEDQHVLEGYGTGAVDFLHKPLNPAILQSKVAVFAELHRTSRALRTANMALVREVAERQRAQEELHRLTSELEQRMADRTANLVKANSDLRSAEAALREAARHKDEFLATLAHELRNPLAPIRNALHILHLKGSKTPELEWAKDVIDRQAKQMTRLVDDLLDVSRITTGKLALQKGRIELAAVVQGAIETSRPLVEQCGHELTVELPPEPVMLGGDMTRLAQVLSNLLNNAARYTERGGSIRLAAERQREEVLISVTDNGMGITPEILPHIFEMFAQGDRNFERNLGGLGVGLTLVKRLVELHGGSVEAHSEGPGRGSRFIVRLPVLADSPTIEREQESLGNSPAAPQLRILVVDDNDDNADSLAIMLRIMGHDTRIGRDGLAAVEIAEAFRPDVVLLDLGMPKMDGYEACRRIRDQAWGKEMVLIAQTGWGQDEDRRRTQAAGFDHHLVKPIKQAELVKLLAERIFERNPIAT